jgi:alpha-mannosidase
VYVTILKPLGDGKETIIRLRSLSDKPEKVTLTFPSLKHKSLSVCTLNEEKGELTTGTISLLPYGMITLKMECE